MNFINNIKKSLTTNFFNFKGRASKYEFFSFIIFLLIVYFTLLSIYYFNTNIQVVNYGIFSIFIILFIPFASISVRRLHDFNESMFLFIIFMIFSPFYPILLLLSLIKGSGPNNMYGLRPVDAELKYKNIYEYLNRNNELVSINPIKAIAYSLSYGYLDFHGRASRTEFISFQGFLFLIILLIAYLSPTTNQFIFRTEDLTVTSMFLYTYFLLFGLPQLASFVRRCHDLNMSFIFIIFIYLFTYILSMIALFIAVIYGAENFLTISSIAVLLPFIVFFMLSILKGSADINRYGHSFKSYNNKINNPNI